MIVSKVVHRGRLRGSRIGASIKVAACEAVGLLPDDPSVRLRGWIYVGEPEGLESGPDVIFDLVQIIRPAPWPVSRKS